VRSGDRLGLRATVALELGPDAREGRQRTVIVEREPDHILLLGFRVRLGRVFGKAVERHEASVLSLQPTAPVRRRGVADVGDGRPAGAVACPSASASSRGRPQYLDFVAK
jgi:hypothetical protein